jgi:hypothetical protein
MVNILLSLSYYYRSLIYPPFPPSQENSSNWRDAKLVSGASLFIEEIGAGFASWKDCGITASVWIFISDHVSYATKEISSSYHKVALLVYR